MESFKCLAEPVFVLSVCLPEIFPSYSLAFFAIPFSFGYLGLSLKILFEPVKTFIDILIDFLFDSVLSTFLNVILISGWLKCGFLYTLFKCICNMSS